MYSRQTGQQRIGSLAKLRTKKNQKDLKRRAGAGTVRFYTPHRERPPEKTGRGRWNRAEARGKARPWRVTMMIQRI